MTEKKPIAKSQAIKGMLAKHPKASTLEVVEMLSQSGVSVTPNFVSNVREAENMKMDKAPSDITADTSSFNPADSELKMSAVILKLAEPFLRKYNGNRKRMESAVGVTIFVWNKLLLPDAMQSDIDRELIDRAVPQDGRAEDVGMIVSITELITERRNRLYPDLKQLIVDYDLQISKTGLDLNVSSVPIKPRSEAGK